MVLRRSVADAHFGGTRAWRFIHNPSTTRANRKLLIFKGGRHCPGVRSDGQCVRRTCPSWGADRMRTSPKELPQHVRNRRCDRGS
ncbi:hypothetical protein GLA29479_2305 [Lysobacter antibioticus]|uniref:Uncharacterized protein n=1 Tax=Lysobacter antibioticus TaxID=84531 RepID=A0A0S2DX96_LYSAN|nr:hypothetical protein GLA29479_2305 [Lysobacter antibioticus]ALN82478.1 hypothetical protein LA76x_4368 [Lysobacter antibioticus]